jgi:SPX domain protein involved in polyphosphate accumulation
VQLINSVYMDNSSCELYHGRLDKKPGAIALRVRWWVCGWMGVECVDQAIHSHTIALFVTS